MDSPVQVEMDTLFKMPVRQFHNKYYLTTYEYYCTIQLKMQLSSVFKSLLTHQNCPK